MRKQNIIFNLDDTLIECNKYFHLVNEQYAALMKEWFPGIPADTVRAKQVEYDLAVVDKNGLTVDHVSQSFMSAYGFFCKETGRTPRQEEVHRLEELGNSVFTMPVEPLPHMYETLEELKAAGHELYLHTGGEEKNQWRKITQLQLAAYFDNRVFISRHKDVEALAKIMDRMEFNPVVTWMVGNSLRTDVLPGLEQGINVIYIPAPNEWHYNVVDVTVQPKGAFLTLGSLNQVPAAILGYTREHGQAGLGEAVSGSGEPGWSATASAQEPGF